MTITMKHHHGEGGGCCGGGKGHGHGHGEGGGCCGGGKGHGHGHGEGHGHGHGHGEGGGCCGGGKGHGQGHGGGNCKGEGHGHGHGEGGGCCGGGHGHGHGHGEEGGCGCGGHHDDEDHQHHHHDDEDVMAVFVCTGKMGSGKTTLVKETVMTQEWIAEGKTLLIAGEDGEVKYDEEYLAEKNIELVTVGDIAEMTAEFFDNLVEAHQPVQVVFECAENWPMEVFMNLMYPEDWDLQGVYSTVDGTEFHEATDAEREAVFANLTESDLIIVNRCPEGFNRAEMRRAIRMINPGADMIFEDLKGQVIQPTEEDLPYDISQEILKISDEDFGFFYLDTFDNPDRYHGKTVQLKVQTLNAIDLEEKLFIAARKIAMGETEFHGYPCLYQGNVEVAEEGWVLLTAEIKYEFFESDDEKQPLFYLVEMKETDAPENQVIDLGM